MRRAVTMIAALGVALAVGFGAGFYTKSRFVLAEQVKEARAAVGRVAESIAEALEQARRVEESISAGDQLIDRVEKVIAKRPIQQNTQKTEGKDDENAVTSQSRARDVFDACTVRLLNAARLGRPVEPAGCGNGEVKATTPTARR